MYITKQELQEYIDSFGKQPGEYTEQEIALIGAKHKQLCSVDKSWAALATLLGWKGTDNSLRCWVLRHAESTNTQSNQKQTKEKSELDFVKKTEELKKAQQQVRDNWTTYNRLLREDARIDSLKACIKETIPTTVKLPYIAYVKDTTIEDVEAILMLSDLHIGTICNNCYNKFDDKIAEARLMKLADDTIAYCKHMKVERLNVVNLGDLIAGIIHTTIRLEQQFDVVSQIMVAAELVGRLLNRLQAAAPEVIYRSCTDNHSRSIANKNEAIEKENFYRLIDWYIEERLKNTNIIFKNNNLDDSFGKFYLLNGKTVMFAHGHLDKPKFAFQGMIGATKEFVDYILLAHYHNPSEHTSQNCKVWTNGSIVGTEQYALSKRLFTEPAQKLLIFKEDNILDITINLTNIEPL